MPQYWTVSGLRLSVFSREQIQVSDQDWKTVTGQDEAPNRQTVAGLRRLSGNALGGVMSIGAGPGRVDIILGPDETVAEKEAKLKLPGIGEWDKLRQQFLDATTSWLETHRYPFNRLAFGAILMRETESGEAAYEQLDDLLIALEVDPKRMRDLLYQVNWPRQSEILQGLTLNRLTTWSVLRLVRKLVAMTGAEITAAKEEDVTYALRLELDHNTEDARVEPFDQTQIVPIYRELMELAVANATHGELS